MSTVSLLVERQLCFLHNTMRNSFARWFIPCCCRCRLWVWYLRRKKAACSHRHYVAYALIIFTFILRSLDFSGNGKLQQQQMIKFPMRSLAPNKSRSPLQQNFQFQTYKNKANRRAFVDIHLRIDYTIVSFQIRYTINFLSVFLLSKRKKTSAHARFHIHIYKKKLLVSSIG